MRFFRPQFTVRRMMVAVALVACLIPFPILMTGWIAPTLLVFWLPVVAVAYQIGDRVSRNPIQIAAFIGLCVGSLCAIVLGSGISWRNVVFLVPFTGLTMANYVGPVHAACRARRGEPLTSGHLVWTWMGLVWSTFLVATSSSCARRIELQLMAESCRLTLVVAVLLALYGSRPIDKRAVWEHYIGWILVESNVILCGLIAAQSLW